MNLKKITDSVIASQEIVVGNINDLANALVKLVPSVSDEESARIIDTIDANYEEGSKVLLTLSSTKLDSEFSFKVNSFWLAVNSL